MIRKIIKLFNFIVYIVEKLYIIDVWFIIGGVYVVYFFFFILGLLFVFVLFEIFLWI